MRRWVVGVAIAAAALALALPAVANHTSPQDGNDTEGLLDLRTVRLGHQRPLVWTFLTIARWRPRQIYDRGYFVVELDTRGDQSIDYVVVLRSRRQEMLGTLHRVLANGTQAEIAKLQSDKFGGRSAWVALGLEEGPHRSAANVVLLGGVLAVHRDAVSDNVHRPGPRPGLRRRAAGGARPHPDAEPEPNAEPEPVAESIAHHPTAFTLTSRRAPRPIRSGMPMRGRWRLS